ncbi:MAG: hypothetical protein H0T79_16935, partial [Deltaproteobacteria bacterium]|nr:hypothetical protein [Deltaproteobacteria bacterium]
MWKPRPMPVPEICASVPIAAGTGHATFMFGNAWGAYARNRIATWPGASPVSGLYAPYV